MPQFLFIKIERFSENNFFKEKNSTIVNFPLVGLDLSELIPGGGQTTQTRYNLIGNVVHAGSA